MGSITGQIFSFMVMLCIGVLAGILFDVYRVLRSLWKPRKIGTFIGDIIFWILMTILVFTLLLIGNWGEIRIYVFLGTAAGCYGYIKFVSKKAQKIMKRIFFYIGKILSLIWRIITWPFQVIIKILIIPLGLAGTAFMGCINLGRRVTGKVRTRVGGIAKALFKKQPIDKE
ncbi:MAG: spore cortex biosynthesis protein YabQ [Peptococcaceae bacterium]